VPLEIFVAGVQRRFFIMATLPAEKNAVSDNGLKDLEAKSAVQPNVVPTAVASAKPVVVKEVHDGPKAPTPTAEAKEEKPVVKVKMPSLQQMLEAGSHFGHKVSRWNPAMREYIFDTRGGMHVIDLTKTMGMLQSAVEGLSLAARRGNILLVGTKGQAATIIKNAGTDHGAFYISRRWPGGLLTNFRVVHKSVRRLMELEEDLAAGRGYETKHERLVLEREMERLAVLYEGICFMDTPPVAMVVIDTKVERNAIKEALKLNVPVVAIIDTNCDPRMVEYPIPGNDDAIKSIDLFMEVLVQAFSNTETSARLIGQRNDFRSRVEQIQRERLAEEERKRKEREYEIARLKAMKEGKAVELPSGMSDSEGNRVRVVSQETGSDGVEGMRTVRVQNVAASEKPAAAPVLKKAVVVKRKTVRKEVAEKVTKPTKKPVVQKAKAKVVKAAKPAKAVPKPVKAAKLAKAAPKPTKAAPKKAPVSASKAVLKK
jgi:small subunit ribosomal protein S2